MNPRCLMTISSSGHVRWCLSGWWRHEPHNWRLHRVVSRSPLGRLPISPLKRIAVPRFGIGGPDEESVLRVFAWAAICQKKFPSVDRRFNQFSPGRYADIPKDGLCYHIRASATDEVWSWGLRITAGVSIFLLLLAAAKHALNG